MPRLGTSESQKWKRRQRHSRAEAMGAGPETFISHCSRPGGSATDAGNALSVWWPAFYSRNYQILLLWPFRRTLDTCCFYMEPQSEIPMHSLHNGRTNACEGVHRTRSSLWFTGSLLPQSRNKMMSITSIQNHPDCVISGPTSPRLVLCLSYPWSVDRSRAVSTSRQSVCHITASVAVLAGHSTMHLHRHDSKFCDRRTQIECRSNSRCSYNNVAPKVGVNGGTTHLSCGWRHPLTRAHWEVHYWRSRSKPLYKHGCKTKRT